MLGLRLRVARPVSGFSLRFGRRCRTGTVFLTIQLPFGRWRTLGFLFRPTRFVGLSGIAAHCGIASHLLGIRPLTRRLWFRIGLSRRWGRRLPEVSFAVSGMALGVAPLGV